VEEGAATQFQVYDIELKALADQLARSRTATFDDVASELAAVGLALDTHHTPLPGSRIDQGVTAAVQEALNSPTRGASFLPLLVRDLGLQHGYDLAHAVPASRVKLDPLQAWLIVADVTLPVLRQLPVPGSTHAAVDARRASLPADCTRYNQAAENLKSQIQKEFGGGIKGWIGEKAVGIIYGQVKGYVAKAVVDTIVNDTPWSSHFLIQLGLESAKNALALAKQIEGLLHSSLLAYSVDVRALDESLRTNWLRSDDPSTGKPLTFRVMVRMLDDLGDTLVACGGLVGAKIPPQGPVSGVKVVWKQEGESPLTPEMGKLNGCILGVACIGTTGPDGIASITFTPQTELIPGYGIQKEKTGLMTGFALYQSKFGAAIPGLVSQVLFPKYGQTRWFVDYHEQPKLELRLSTDYNETYTNQSTGVCVGGTCGTTGTGQQDMALSAAVPLTQTMPTDGGAPIWTGQGALSWSNFSFTDDGAVSLCQDAKFGTMDYDGVSSSPGQVIVDSLTVTPNGADPGVTLTLHSNPNPTYTEKDTWHQGNTLCQDSTNTYTSDWRLDNALEVGDPGIVYTAPGSGAHSSSIIQVTNWKRGPASHGGPGVYAYHEFSISETDGLGDPITKHIRLEIYATPDA
jgi:hypothetical protein